MNGRVGQLEGPRGRFAWRWRRFAQLGLAIFAISWAAALSMAQPAEAAVDWLLSANFVNLDNAVDLNTNAQISVAVTNGGNSTSPANKLYIDFPKGALTLAGSTSSSTPPIANCALTSTPDPTTPLDPANDRISCDVPSLGGTLAANLVLTLTARTPGAIPIGLKVPVSGVDLSPNAVSLTLNVSSAAVFEITGTGSPGTVDPGAPVNYSFAVKNNGPDAAIDSAVEVVFEAGLEIASVPSNCSLVGLPDVEAEHRYSCSYPGSFPAGTTRNLAFTASVWGPNSTVDVTASVRNQGSDAATIASDTVTTLVNPGTTLKITKSRTPNTVLSDQSQVTFTLRPSFSGQAPGVELTVTDTLPANFTPISRTPSAGWSCDPIAQTIVCRRSDFTAARGGSLGTIQIVARANFLETPGANNDPTNIAQLSGSGLQTAEGTNSVSIQRLELDLKASKTAPVLPPTNNAPAGTQFPFEITAINNTAVNAFVGTLELHDRLTANLRATNIASNGWSCKINNTGPVVSGPVNVPAGSTIDCSRIYTTTSPLNSFETAPPVVITAEVVAAGSFTNELDVAPGPGGPIYTDPDIQNNHATFTGSGTTETISADVTVFKTITSSPALWGELTEFKLQPQNLSTSTNAQGVKVTDVFSRLADGNAAIAYSISPGNATGVSCGQTAVNPTTREFSCSMASLPPCEKDVNCPVITLSVRQTGNSSTPITNTTNTASVSSDTSDPDLLNNQFILPYQIWSQPDVFVVKSASPAATVEAGQTLVYSISSRIASPNRGPADARFEDRLPKGMTFVSTSQPAQCTTAPIAEADGGGTLVSCNVGIITAGSRTIQITVRPELELANKGPVTNFVEVFADTDATPDNNTATADVSVTSQLPNLNVQKSDDPHLSYVTRPIIYSIRVSNFGGSDASNVEMKDTLPPDMTFVSYDAPAGITCTAPAAGAATTGQFVTCAIPALARGTSGSKLFTITLRSTRVSTPVNQVHVKLTNPGDAESSTSDNDSSTTSIVVSRVDMEVVSKTADPAAVGLGQEFQYTIRVRNRPGQDPLNPALQLGDADVVTLRDEMPAGMVLTGSPTPVVTNGSTTELSCTGAAGESSFDCAFGTMTNGAELTVTVPVKINAFSGSLPQTFDNKATVSTLSSDVDETNDFKLGRVEVSGAASLAGAVFRDFNNNGVQDPGDTGVGGITMTLTGTGGPGAAPVPVVTSPDGTYLFSNLLLGSYTLVRGAVPADLELSDGIVTPGTAGGTVSGPVTVTGINLTKAAPQTSYDFALVPSAASITITKQSLGDPTVNADGTFNVSFRLTLSNPSLEEIANVVVTDVLAGAAPQFGSYDAGLATPGSYKIWAPPSGSCGGLNSDFDGSTAATVAAAFTIESKQNCTIDFGLQVFPTNPLPPLENGGRYFNQASVTGEASQSAQPVSAQSQRVPVTVDLPRLEIAKEVTGHTDADNSGSVTLNDTLSYKSTATNSGTVPLTNVVVADSRITPSSVTCATLAPNDSCVLTGSLTVTIADVQAGNVINVATAVSDQTPKPVSATTETPVVAVIDKNAITKTALISAAKRGEQVPYEIKVKDSPFNPAVIVDVMPPGFAFVADSAKSNGQAVKPRIEGRKLTFTGLVPDAKGAIKLSLTLIVTASVNPGPAVNQAQLIDPETGAVVATARATVTILSEAVFDCTDIIGKVFDDKNRNGYQDQGEPGLPAVRLATVHGLLITTDPNGRYNIPCADIPDADIGTNFILKLDPRTLPTGYHITTENPRRVRLTRGRMVKLNFGASISRLVKLDLNAQVFEQGSDALKSKWQKGLDQLVSALAAEPSVLSITYRGEDGKLAQARVRAVKQDVIARWSRQKTSYDLPVETRIVGGVQ
ncbi:SdrD B-like domain-containing protein [Aestuariivirga sp.]|uniref:SdrD B-like domain-containing protein n=1 Tax=Aestuariivirga sp. TaxID=2650926 RepID=UPI003BABA843